jgi:hypothetical protein
MRRPTRSDQFRHLLCCSRGPGLAPQQTNNVTLNSAFARTHSDAWAVGTQFAPAGATPPAPPTFHWNGTGWSYVPTPAIGRSAALFSVSASSATDAWAVYYAAATFPGAAKELVVGYTSLGAILSHN